MANENCIFCKIVKGDIPCYKVYEDREFLSFLDVEPLNPGHCLIITKKHYRYVDQVPNFGEYFEVAKKVGVGIKGATDHKQLYYLTLGNAVEHAHIWVFPHFEGDAHGDNVDWEAKSTLGKTEGEVMAKKIKEGIK